jgi:hypothetical protein
MLVLTLGDQFTDLLLRQTAAGTGLVQGCSKRPGEHLPTTHDVSSRSCQWRGPNAGSCTPLILEKSADSP